MLPAPSAQTIIDYGSLTFIKIGDVTVGAPATGFDGEVATRR